MTSGNDFFAEGQEFDGEIKLTISAMTACDFKCKVHSVLSRLEEMEELGTIREAKPGKESSWQEELHVLITNLESCIPQGSTEPWGDSIDGVLAKVKTLMGEILEDNCDGLPSIDRDKHPEKYSKAYDRVAQMVRDQQQSAEEVLYELKTIPSVKSVQGYAGPDRTVCIKLTGPHQLVLDLLRKLSEATHEYPGGNVTEDITGIAVQDDVLSAAASQLGLRIAATP
jgi:hypothetical protein